jgi:hypothetical protein
LSPRASLFATPPERLQERSRSGCAGATAVPMLGA